MPSMEPNVKDLHVDALLTNLSIAYINDPSAYVADKLFPIVAVRKQSDIIPKYDKGAWFRDEAQLRAPGTESEGGGYTVDTTSKYYCDNYAYHRDIPDELRENADAPFSPDVEATRFVTDKALMRRERAWVSDFFTTTAWDTHVHGGTDFTQWDDYALSDPIKDVDTGVDTIYKNTAKNPKKFLIGRQVWTKLKHHPDFLDRIKYTQRAILTKDLIASIMELDQILVGEALYNSAKQGQSDTMAFIFGKHGLLLYVTGAPSLMEPSAGYCFVWTRLGGLSYIRRLRDDKPMVDRIEIQMWFDQKAVCTDCGYFFDAIVG